MRSDLLENRDDRISRFTRKSRRPDFAIYSKIAAAGFRGLTEMARQKTAGNFLPTGALTSAGPLKFKFRRDTGKHVRIRPVLLHGPLPHRVARRPCPQWHAGRRGNGGGG